MLCVTQHDDVSQSLLDFFDVSMADDNHYHTGICCTVAQFLADDAEKDSTLARLHHESLPMWGINQTELAQIKHWLKELMKMAQPSELDSVRAQIDALDIQIQDLITQRALLAEDVAKAKRAVEAKPHFYRPEREAQVVQMAIARNQGPLSDETIQQLFRHIMSACLALQQPLSVAYLGPKGTYSQAAAEKHFGQSIEQKPVRSIESVFQAVLKGQANYGVVPVENSSEGGVNTTLDTLVTTSLQLCGEVELPIHHYLLSHAPDLAQIKRVYSHQQSLGQCQHWLNENLPHAQLLAVVSNADAAQRARIEPDVAAIAGETAMQFYRLPALAQQIEDHPRNTTRFVVLGQYQTQPTGHDKTSLVLSSADADHAGDLYRILKPLAKANINMTKIESRPSHQSNWNYVFFIDIEGHQLDDKLRRVLQKLRQRCAFFKILGSYPRVG